MPEKFALVTGSSSGIGMEIARQLAARGYSLILVSNEEEQLLQLKYEVERNHNIKALVISMNLAESNAARQVYKFCLDRKLEVEVLVNNAGFFFFGEAVAADIEMAEQMIQLHVLTTSLFCSLFGQDMKERKRGFILNTSSISAFKAFPGIAYYGATKAYIRSFSRSLRTELKYHQVQVTCLCPGATATNLYDAGKINMEFGKRTGIMMDAAYVAKKAVDGLFNDKAIVVPGISSKLLMLLMILIPQWLIYMIRKKSKYLR